MNAQHTPEIYEFMIDRGEGDFEAEFVMLSDYKDIEQQRAELLAELQSILDRVPAKMQGQYFTDHHSMDGEYQGTEYHNPDDILDCVLGCLEQAIAKAQGAV